MLSVHAQDAARTLAAVPQLLALVHAVEGPAGGGTLAPLAEALLDAVAESGCSDAAEQVAMLRSATAKRRAEMAARRRQQMLASMSFSQARKESKWCDEPSPARTPVTWLLHQHRAEYIGLPPAWSILTSDHSSGRANA